MPANIKDVFDNFPKEMLNKPTTNQNPIIKYEDVKHQSNYEPYDIHDDPVAPQDFGEYKPKPRKPKNKPVVDTYIADPYNSEINDNIYKENPMPVPVYIQQDMERKIEELTCKEVDKHISQCKDCQNKLGSEKIIYIKDKKAETSQEVMELLMFLATGIFIILVLDKLN